MSKFMEKIKKLNAPTDMTVGAPWRGILAFTLPMLIGNIAQQLYSTVDSIVVGRYIGASSYTRSNMNLRSSFVASITSSDIRTKFFPYEVW